MGNLYIVATPIGNLQDISLRALKTLESVDFIACEDTRTTSILIKKYFETNPKQILDKMFSYYEQTEKQKIPHIVDMLLEGKNIALVSDAGTPTISDPGFKLVRECIAHKIKVISIPGASSAISALVSSGLPTDKFTFLGFLPQKEGHRLSLLKNALESEKNLSTTIIFFESPHKLKRTLEDMLKVFGNINITIARELTKIHEEIKQGNLKELVEEYSIKKARGEIVILFNLQ